MPMKKILFFTLALTYNLLTAQTPISWTLMSQNGWRPDVVGGGATPSSPTTCPGLNVTPNIPCQVFGNVDALWGNVQTSSAKFIRYGGTTADQNIPNNLQYLA